VPTPTPLFVAGGENQLVQKGKGPECMSGHKGNSMKHMSVHSAAGRALLDSELYPGAAHDFRITNETKDVGHGFTVTPVFTAEHGMSLPMLVDGGFQGSGQLIPGGILPRRRPRGEDLDSDDEAYNDTIRHDRMVVKNFSGRKKRPWRIAKDQYRCTLAHALSWSL
jgi:hypothetical protein